jgi:hypothetical protein
MAHWSRSEHSCSLALAEEIPAGRNVASLYGEPRSSETKPFIHGRVAQLGHVLLYRSYQSQLHGFWRGGLIWLADTINSYVRPKFRFARD